MIVRFWRLDLVAVGLSQAIQLPVAIAATVGNVIYGELDWLLAGVLAAALMVGWYYWLNAGYAVVAALAILKRRDCEPWRAFRAGLREAMEAVGPHRASL